MYPAIIYLKSVKNTTAKMIQTALAAIQSTQAGPDRISPTTLLCTPVLFKLPSHHSSGRRVTELVDVLKEKKKKLYLDLRKQHLLSP